MADNVLPGDIDLETFLKSAGESFTAAQKTLVPTAEVSVNMMLSNIDLEVKVAVSADVKGKMSIKPISSDDISKGTINPGLLSTIRMSFVSSIGELKAQPNISPVDDNTGKGNVAPALIGMTLDEAVTLLKAADWRYELHAAGSEEIASAGKERRGKVLRQAPPAAQTADKTTTVVNLWIDLGTVPVAGIEGIGTKLGDRLIKAGISTIGELSLAEAGQVAAALRVSEVRAKSYIDMAGLMTRLAILGFKDQVAELLVKGAGIRTMEQLAAANQEALFKACQTAIGAGKVTVPRGFKLAADDVAIWIKTAASYLAK
jgi:hypothetical protein